MTDEVHAITEPDQLEPESLDLSPDDEPEVDDNTPSGEGEAGAVAPAEPDPSYTPADDTSSIRAEMEELRRRAESAEAKSSAAQEVFTQNLTYQDRVRQQQAEQEAIAAMTPAERLAYQSEIEKRELRQIAAQTKAELEDSKDRNEFSMMALDNAVAREHAKEVEKRIQEAHAAGYTHVKRTTILKDLIGEKVLNGVMKGTTKQMQQAQARQQQSASSPTVSTGDVGADVPDKTNSDKEARNARLAQGKHGGAY